jgi:hypothetical protein
MTWSAPARLRPDVVYSRAVVGELIPHATVLADELFWVIVGVLAAVVIGVVTIVITARSRPRPALAYETQATRLVARQAAGRLEITFDGEPVEDVHLVDLTVANTGNRPFVDADFVRPLHVVLPEGAVALSAEVTGSDPPGLEPKAGIEPETGATVRLALLNPRDGFTVSVLVKGLKASDEVRLGGRVAGVHEFDHSTQSAAGMLAEVATAAMLTSDPGLGAIGVAREVVRSLRRT